MKKNRTMRIATLMLALTLITCCFVGSTFAKYVSDADLKNDTVKVAKWSIDLNGSDVATVEDEVIVFDLFKDAISLDNNGTDVNVGLIAPGTEGSFTFEIANDSDVTAEYKLTYTMTETAPTGLDIPVEYSLTADFADAKDDIAELNMNAYETIAIDGDDSVTVYWRWVIGDDAAAANDTALGVAAAANADSVKIEVSAKIDVQQVD